MTDQNGASGDGGAGAAAGKPLAAEDVERIAASIFNNGFTARMKTFQKQINDQLSETLNTSLKKQIEDAFAQLPSKGKSAKGKEGADPAEGDDPQSPAVRSMKRQLEEMATELSKQKATSEAATKREKDMALRQKSIEALGTVGISDPSRTKAALATLFQDGRISYDEDGESIIFKDSDGSPLDLPTGVKAWAKSEEAKIFLPPTGARGSGDRPGQGAPKQAGDQSLSATDIGLAIAREFGGIPIG